MRLQERAMNLTFVPNDSAALPFAICQSTVVLFSSIERSFKLFDGAGNHKGHKAAAEKNRKK
jgi:hypothetical protein